MTCPSQHTRTHSICGYDVNNLNNKKSRRLKERNTFWKKKQTRRRVSGWKKRNAEMTGARRSLSQDTIET